MSSNIEQATLGGGCFWCTEAVFNQLKGIALCESGYSGGSDPAPNYDKVCAGKTGHAEVIRLHYDPEIISFRKILAVFFAIHDPTTLNRQGNDIGTQYRSVIFFHTPEQHDAAVAFVEDLARRKIFRDKVVTEISPLLNYFPAEKHHQEYFENNPMQPYCAYVVAPKVEKAEDLFGDMFKR
ncbi:MAG: peptide-methionine (S)-S-oxide reductase MsrA [Gammaproteobacteria bacterium]|uniref:peptide-methionine (S)-S-oxide reductase MsrA n=1 Tax=Limnobacter sp. TaxID=2003368 RepID=UPI001D96763D|nr:peptide-methionine (S)-S-oxide reductase MsrA [Limnobacter sp.]MBU0784678.1 peptide-methionine (S)-S-oxide reductase MsrA [Gammaproteobacteria bacterium]MBU0848063.1 peptide-methionine (S)-S-oxide reductase MsrA [Gammaproteobacteria bacterium]MBU1266354.1 peptide-methionine (S)-S-oxide reductase MsrA [Gammaproteobacteria bacterium]MBU1529963.1 peptide-methionine (S)-S-oxide reductase MsrA [Gammaproteobacteria bacterium]MBU1779900.1 peptide-methionine (S)-S-oxide reductase MsrA [Gammaproteob